MENNLVWAKMKGFAPWPGKICAPTQHLAPKPKGQPHKWIFFFGSKNYSWIEESNLKPYVEFRDSMVKTIKNNPLKEAVKRCDEYLSDPEKYKANAPSEPADEDTDATFNKLRESDESPELESPSSPLPPKVAPKKTSVKKKSTKRPSGTNGDIGEAPPSPSPKRPRPDTTTPIYTPSRHNAVTSLIDRVLEPPIEPPQRTINIEQSQKLESIVPSDKKFGFIGVGIMGSGIVKNLLNSGHKVCIWNRDPDKSRKFETLGAEVVMTPCDVAEQADIIFSCVSDPNASKEIVFGNCGILSSTQHFDGKGYVEMTGLDGDTSQDIADAIVSKGGRYLEAQMQGSRIQAEEGTLIILAAGERTLFDECQSCFKAIGKNSFYLGDVGNASKMYLVLQLFTGNLMAALAESLALADRAGLQKKDVLEVLELTTLSSPYISEKGRAITEQDFATHQPLTHMQKDIRLGLLLSEQIDQTMPITAATNEVFKHAKRNGYSGHDVSAVYKNLRI